MTKKQTSTDKQDICCADPSHLARGMCSCYEEGGRSHSWEIHCLSHPHKPLCSVSIWEACVFVCPLCEGYFGHLATVLLLQQRSPIKKPAFIHSLHFFAFEGTQSGITEGITVTFQWSAMENPQNTKQTGVNVENNERRLGCSLTFLSGSFICFSLLFLKGFGEFLIVFLASLGWVRNHCSPGHETPYLT